ncbi:hypothetical protein K0M31_018529 [Melipona bicolor]|uniref:Uncharacterized protein n=1 Tax=Melipona bicolor TaxID=60889 RepID=A0AA40G3R6_9HYME|nr:hypothetical protein K0M31_018529 [Melipona bicolor]
MVEVSAVTKALTFNRCSILSKLCYLQISVKIEKRGADKFLDKQRLAREWIGVFGARIRRKRNSERWENEKEEKGRR